jgi:hypothetical protein
LPYHRIAGVVVGKIENQPSSFDRLGEVKRGRKRGGDRLVADDVKASFEKRLSRCVVGKIRGDDCDRIHGVGPCFLARHHVLESAICPVGSDPQRDGAGFCTNGIRRHGSGDELVVTVKPRGYAMNATNKGTGPTAHHAKAQLASYRRLLLAFNRHFDIPAQMPRPDAAQRNPTFQRVAANQLTKPEHPPIGRHIHSGRREIIEGPARRFDDVSLYEGCAFGCTLLGTLNAAFPFQHGPAVKSVLGELRKDAAKTAICIWSLAPQTTGSRSGSA